MLEDTNSLDGAQITFERNINNEYFDKFIEMSGKHYSWKLFKSLSLLNVDWFYTELQI